MNGDGVAATTGNAPGGTKNRRRKKKSNYSKAIDMGTPTLCTKSY